MTGRERRLVFGEVADLYDRIRPTYPDELVDRILAYAGPVRTAIDIGAGTGRISLPVARRGVVVTALEPSAEMAAVLRRRSAAADIRVGIVETTFEAHDPAEPVDLVTAAQSWHWVDPSVGFRRAHDVLRPGGTLALIWNRPTSEGADIRDEIDAIYRTYEESTGGPDSPISGPTSFGGRANETSVEQMVASGWFTDARLEVVRWARTLSRDDYLDLLRTQSGHRLLDPAVREALLAELGQLIDSSGGTITSVYDAEAYVARATD